MIICPNLSNPDVAREFNELKNATSEAAAYHIWSLNNGNGIDKAPNGALSKLFLTLLEHYNGDRVKAIQAKAKTYGISFLKWFGNWTGQEGVLPEYEESNSVSKVVDENGEPLVVWHGGSNTNIFDTSGKRSGGAGIKKGIKGSYFTTSKNDAKRYENIYEFKTGEQWIAYADQLREEGATEEEIAEIDRLWETQKPATRAFFLNIKTPIETIYTGNDKDGYTENANTPENYDGQHITIEGKSYEEYVATNPNQIKSIDNEGPTPYEGTFSAENDDIYYNLSTESAARKIRDDLAERGLIHSFRGDRVTKRVKDAVLIIMQVCEGTSVYPLFTQNTNSTSVRFVDNVTMSPEAKDEIERTDNKSIGAVIAMIHTLLQKVPQLKVNFINWNQIPEGVRKDANSFVKDGIVYIVANRATEEMVVEEFMHPITHVIQQVNTNLFENLLKEAKKDFPKLWAEIKDTYTNKKGFNESDRENELVTQALARYVHSGYKNAQNRNKVKDLVRQSLNYILQLLKNAFERIGNKIFVTPEDLPKMSLKELAQLFVADDTVFRVWNELEIRYNIMSNQQKAQKVAEDITKRFSILYKAYEKMPNKSSRRQQIQNKIFETFNKLKRTLDYHAVVIALDFALDQLGSWDVSTNTPTKENSISGYLYKQSQLSEPYSGVTPENLVEMYTNSIGFYENLLANYIPNNIDEMMTEEDRNKKTQVESLIHDYIKPMWLKAMSIVGDKIVDEIIDGETTISPEDKLNMKTVAKDWLHKNIMYGDIKAYTAFIYNNSYVKNPIIRQAFHLIQEAETKTLEELQPIARRITGYYQRANKGHRRLAPNWLTVLMEFNRDGIPTGNFVRDINYGLYEEDLENFVKKLNEKFEKQYGHTYVEDETGVVINSLTGDLAENEEWGSEGEEPVYIKYLKEIEKWKCEHSNRRYTINYYLERMSAPYKGSLDPNDTDTRAFGHGLSPKTLAKYNYIQSNINYYLDLCTDPKTGFSHPEELSFEDKQKLDQYKNELEELSNPYNPDGTAKLDNERQMAFEIRAWEKYIGDKFTTFVDFDAFQDEYDRIVEKSKETNNPRLITDFFKYNSSLGINPKFIDATFGKFPKSMHTEPIAIHAELIKRALLSMIKTKNKYTRDLSKMENNPGFWLDCKRTDQILEDMRSEKHGYKWDLGTVFDTITFWIDWSKKQPKRETSNKNKSQDEFNELFGIKNTQRDWDKIELEWLKIYKEYWNTKKEEPVYDFFKRMMDYIMEDNFSNEEIIYRDEYGFALDANGNQVKPEDEDLHNDLLTYREYMINYYTKIAMASPNRSIPGLNDTDGNPIQFNGDFEDVKRIMTKLFSYNHEYEDKQGNIIVEQKPLTIFTMMTPRYNDFYDPATKKNELSILYVPKGRFAEKYDHGTFMNTEYDNQDPNSEQPKRKYYDNTEAFNKVRGNDSISNLYDVLIQEMEEAQKHYQTSNRTFNYRLPQINAHTMLILSRIQKRGAVNTLETLWRSINTVEENDESMRTNEDYITNPDGSVATDVPLKFVRKLKHPENITTDIVGSVILFINMALNYKNKCDIDARIKSLRYNLDFKNRKDLYKQVSKEDDEELPPNDNENSAKMFDSMTNKHIYGNQWTGNPNQPKDSNKQANTNSWKGVLSSAFVTGTSGAAIGGLAGIIGGSFLAPVMLGGLVGASLGALQGAIQNGLFEGIALFKGIKKMQRVETTQTLGLNLFSMLVGFGDSMSRVIKESLMGKYMSVRDCITSLASVITRTPQCIANIGNPLANNKLTRAMQLNGISKGVHQIYEHMNYGRVRKIASNLLMGGFSMLDWMANALLLRAFYNNVRFYDGDVVEKGFYSSYELRQAFINAGHTKHEAKMAHMMANTTLWGAYDNNMEVKPEYELYVTQRIKTLIRTKTLKRGALYNGMNPDNDIPVWKQDLIGGIIGSLRSWLAQSMQHLGAGGIDNVVRYYENEVEQEVRRSKTKVKPKRKVLPMTNDQRSRAFSWDYETGTPQDQIIVGLYRSFKTLSNKIQRFFILNPEKRQLKPKAKFSYVEKYAWTDTIIYLGIMIAMMFGWTFVHDWAADVPKPKDRYHAAPESLSPLDIYNYFTDVYIPNEYYKLQIDNLMFRIIESLLTNINPGSMSDIVNSVTALKNAVLEHAGIVQPIFDITGLSGHTLDEEVKQGGYKFYTRGERSLYKFVGPLDNLHTFFDYYGIVQNENFYINTYGGLYRKFGYDFKKEQPKVTKTKDTNLFGGGFDGGDFGGGDFGGGF